MNDPFRFPSSTDSVVTDDPNPASPADHPAAPASADAHANDAAAPAPSTPATPSAAEARFASCRWRKQETPPYCTHPEVLPFAGTSGFNPEAWCPECAFYKLRRNPRKDY
jgi:hypothetical protein